MRPPSNGNHFLQPPDFKSESAIVGVSLPPRTLCAHNCQYGVPAIAAAYYGLREPFPELVRGEWAHGWHPPEHNKHPELVVGGDGLSNGRRKTTRYWVARSDQAEYLREQGYRRVSAIGLPIVYLPELSVARKKKSLLVMPVHSLATTKHKWNFESYADSIHDVRSNFSDVVACVHTTCFDKGYWAAAFLKRDIPVITGAHLYDQHSLLRMGILFSRFEYLTTNGFGSHIAYGSYFGSKVSIYGETAKYGAADFQDELIYRNRPELIPLVLEMLTENYLRTTYAWLFREPWRALGNQDWGRFQVGFGHKIAPRKMATVLFNRKARLRRFFLSAMGLAR